MAIEYRPDGRGENANLSFSENCAGANVSLSGTFVGKSNGNIDDNQVKSVIAQEVCETAGRSYFGPAIAQVDSGHPPVLIAIHTRDHSVILACKLDVNLESASSVFPKVKDTSVAKARSLSAVAARLKPCPSQNHL
jgi:hypothetical protein